MSFHLLHLPKLVAARSATAVFGLAIIFLLWGGVFLKFYDDICANRLEAQRANSNFAVVFEENVLRSLGEIDKALLYLRRTIETRNADVDFHTIISTTDVLSEIIVQVAIIDANGMMRASNAGPQPAPPIDLSDREHYRAHLYNNKDELFMSKPVVGRVSHQWSVQFTRRFLNPDGSLGGVVVASLNPDHFTNFYNRINFRARVSIALIGRDGIVRSSGGNDNVMTLGQDLNETEFLRAMQGGQEVDFETIAANGANARLVTARTVRGHPLWVVVSRDKADLLRNAWANLGINSLLAVLATIIVLIAMERMLAADSIARQNEAQIAKLASEDSLTGLPNRRAFRSKLESICERRCRVAFSSEEKSFAVLFLDLDRFKIVNDTLGHCVGDRLLQEVATRLTQQLPATAMLARLGGDEFAIVVEAVESVAAVEAWAGKIVSAVSMPYDFNGYHIRSGISIGIAFGPADGETVDSLLVAADLALYAVKEHGRGSYKVHHPEMNVALNRRRELETGLRLALERDEFELHYQPIADLRHNTITGFEALVRWRHPTNGILLPGEFISAAEETGLMIPIGAWVLREAVKSAAAWPDDIRIAVNISPSQLLDPSFVTMVQHALGQSGLAPDRLELEITEQILMEDSQPVWRVLRQLRKLGVRVALDDFGTGYSSLSYLRKFPFSKIKIDRSFVSQVTEHAVIVQAVVNIARALNMTTTAEGVEEASQQAHVASLGCDEAQGHFISAPLSASAVEQFLNSAGWYHPKAA